MPFLNENKNKTTAFFSGKYFGLFKKFLNEHIYQGVFHFSQVLDMKILTTQAQDMSSLLSNST